MRSKRNSTVRQRKATTQKCSRNLINYQKFVNKISVDLVVQTISLLRVFLQSAELRFEHDSESFEYSYPPSPYSDYSSASSSSCTTHPPMRLPTTTVNNSTSPHYSDDGDSDSIITLE
jgi:hypothetical protein